VSWRSWNGAGGGPAAITIMLAAAALSMAIAATAQAAVATQGPGATQAAGAAPTASTTGVAPGSGLTHPVSAAAQRGALAFWTPARMEQAAVVQQAARSGTAATAPKGIPAAVHFNGVPTTGALFYTTGGKKHYCTASVVDSQPGNLVLTAAHCVYQDKKYATNIEYVPAYHNGLLPYGGWAVRVITVASGWVAEQDPDLDFAFLAVGPATGTQIQARTGGLALGINRWDQETVEVIGYNDTDDGPVRCLTESFKFRTGQMEFYCHDYWTGTSGGPWIIGYNSRTGTGTVCGVIGGYEQGGDSEWASYSSYFGSQLRTLFQQAESQPAIPSATAPTSYMTG
jgi:V8-like Glu-specific endopeptidase